MLQHVSANLCGHHWVFTQNVKEDCFVVGRGLPLKMVIVLFYFGVVFITKSGIINVRMLKIKIYCYNHLVVPIVDKCRSKHAASLLEGT